LVRVEKIVRTEVSSEPRFNNMFNYYSTPVGKRSTAITLSLCVSVCLSTSISLKPLDQFSRNFCADPHGRGSVLLWPRCDMLCTSGFIDDVTFGHSGLYGNAWKAEPLPLAAFGYRGRV